MIFIKLKWVVVYKTAPFGKKRLVQIHFFADIVILVKRVVQIVAVGLSHRRRATAPTRTKVELTIDN